MKVKYVEAMVTQYKDDLPLESFSGIDSIRSLIERDGLLPGDEVAILLLEDLRALIANQKEAAA